MQVESLDELATWLAANHNRDEGVWLVRFKKSVPAKFINRLDVIDELLRFGWVDGIARKLDNERTMQVIFPRKQQAWAQSYKDRAARLEAEGRMEEPGRAAIERSKRLGMWEAYAPVDALLVPDDLRAALRDHVGAEAFFDGAAPSYRRNVLRWIAQAKRPETRARRIITTASFPVRGTRCRKCDLPRRACLGYVFGPSLTGPLGHAQSGLIAKRKRDRNRSSGCDRVDRRISDASGIDLRTPRRTIWSRPAIHQEQSGIHGRPAPALPPLAPALQPRRKDISMTVFASSARHDSLASFENAYAVAIPLP